MVRVQEMRVPNSMTIELSLRNAHVSMRVQDRNAQAKESLCGGEEVGVEVKRYVWK